MSEHEALKQEIEKLRAANKQLIEIEMLYKAYIDTSGWREKAKVAFTAAEDAEDD